ncbi:MAG: sulfatase, partial [Gemmatimonadetes bacterium]|nr:sulfatase [Gemmatimonadota bacterium]
PPSPPPNVIVILSDTHRADYVSPDNAGTEPITPNLELLAADGIRYEQAYTVIPTSAPAYASLLTGLLPTEHGVFFNEQELRPDLPVIPERFTEAGYTTAGIVSNGYCIGRYGFDRGFSFFWDWIENRGKEGRHVTDAALKWLSGRTSDEPFFLFLAYMDAHVPFILPERAPSLLVSVDGVPRRALRAEAGYRDNVVTLRLAPGDTEVTLHFLDDLKVVDDADAWSRLRIAALRSVDERVEVHVVSGIEGDPDAYYRDLANEAVLRLRNPTDEAVGTELRFRCSRIYEHSEYAAYYLDGVRAVDDEVGRVVGALKAAGLYDDTVIVFLSDHGDMLGEHDEWGHIRELYEEVVRIPLIVKPRGGVEETRDDTLVDLLDVHDALAGIVEGRSLRLQPRSEDELLAAAYPPEPRERLVAVRRGDWKVLAGTDSTRLELYDLGTDPREQVNLVDVHRDAPFFREMMEEVREELVRAAEAATLDLATLPGPVREQLQALGYVE